MINTRTTTLAVACALLLAASTATQAGATPPGPNGQISFMRLDDADHWQVWVANPDLSHAHPITEGDYPSGWAKWSPDGQRLAFHSERTDPDPNDDDIRADVFTMRADGTDVQKVTDSSGFSQTPAWSPDGSLIAFSYVKPSEYPESVGIYVIRPDGTGLRRVTSLPSTSVFQESPEFSPDGRQLVFTEYGDPATRKNTCRGNPVEEISALFVVNLDGTGRHQITPWGARNGNADWSPDGRRIVYEGGVDPCRKGAYAVVVVDADGKHLKRLTNDSRVTGNGNPKPGQFEGSFDPTWSPDGTKILFSHDALTPTGEFTTGLQTINPDGTGQQYIADTRGIEHTADWGTAPLAP